MARTSLTRPPLYDLHAPLRRLYASVSYNAHTIVLFTIADLKTIFFPIVRTHPFSPLHVC